MCLMGGGWSPSCVGVAASRFMLMPWVGMMPGEGCRWDGGAGLMLVGGASLRSSAMVVRWESSVGNGRRRVSQ